MKKLIYNQRQLATAVIGTDKNHTDWSDKSHTWSARWASVQKAIYKGTSCGAWIEPIGNTGVTVGSIVEGVDWGTETHSLHYPFRESDLWSALEKVEAEANEIWESTHGCDECGEPDEYNGGHNLY